MSAGLGFGDGAMQPAQPRHDADPVRRVTAPLNPPAEVEQPGVARFVVRIELSDGTSREYVADKPTDWTIDLSAGEVTTLMDWDETTENWITLGQFIKQTLRLDVSWCEPAEGNEQ